MSQESPPSSSSSTAPEPVAKVKRFINPGSEPLLMPTADRRSMITVQPYAQRNSGHPGTYVLNGDDWGRYLPPNGFIAPFPDDEPEASAQPSMVAQFSPLTGGLVDPNSDEQSAAALLDQTFGDSIRVSPEARAVAIGLVMRIRAGETDVVIPPELISATEEIHAVAAMLKPDIVPTMRRDPANDSDQVVDPRVRLSPERTSGPIASQPLHVPGTEDKTESSHAAATQEQEKNAQAMASNESGGSSSKSPDDESDDEDDEDEDDEDDEAHSASSSLAAGQGGHFQTLTPAGAKAANRKAKRAAARAASSKASS